MLVVLAFEAGTGRHAVHGGEGDDPGHLGAAQDAPLLVVLLGADDGGHGEALVEEVPLVRPGQGRAEGGHRVDDDVGRYALALQVVHPLLDEVEARLAEGRPLEGLVAGRMLDDVAALVLDVVGREGLLGVLSVAEVVRGSGRPEPGEEGGEVHVPEALCGLEAILVLGGLGAGELLEGELGEQLPRRDEGLGLFRFARGAVGEDKGFALLEEAGVVKLALRKTAQVELEGEAVGGEW